MSLLFNFGAQEAEKLKKQSVACFVGRPVHILDVEVPVCTPERPDSTVMGGCMVGLCPINIIHCIIEFLSFPYLSMIVLYS